MEKFFKSITSNTYVTVAIMVIVVAFVWDQYHRKDFFGMFPAKSVTTIKEGE